jgi:galactonate dehydratase
MGLTEGMRTVEYADLMHLPVTLHCGIASPIMIAASLHVAASHPRVRFMEYQPVVLNAMNRLLKRPILCRAGSFMLPDGVGLAIEPDEPTLMRFARKITCP